MDHKQVCFIGNGHRVNRGVVLKYLTTYMDHKQVCFIGSGHRVNRGVVLKYYLTTYGLHHKKVSVALPYNVRRTLKRCKKNRVRTLYERKAGVCVERPN